MLNQLCRIQSVANAALTGSILKFVTRKIVRESKIDINAIVLWDNSQTLTTEHLSDIAGIEGENGVDSTMFGTGLCRVTVDGIAGTVIDLVENRVVKASDDSSNAVILKGDNSFVTHPLLGLIGIAAENVPDSGTRISGSGSGSEEKTVLSMLRRWSWIY